MTIKSLLIGAAASVVLASGALASSLVDPPTVRRGDTFNLTINSDGVMIKDLTAIAVIGEGDDEKQFVSDAGVATQSSVMIVVADLELDDQFDKSVKHVDVTPLLFAAAGVEGKPLAKKPNNLPLVSLLRPHPLLDALPGLENAIDVKPLTLAAAGVDEVIAPRFFMEGGPQAIVRGGSRLVDARTTDIIVMVGLLTEVKRPQANVRIDEIGV